MSKKPTTNELIALQKYPEPANPSALPAVYPTEGAISYKERMAFLAGLNYKKQQRENKRNNLQ